jgi:hypothetical protein
MKVKVTKKDIARAIKLRDTDVKWIRSQCCPVALAIKRKSKHIAVVGSAIASIFRAGRQVEYRLPDEARQFVLAFDFDYEVPPITFTMEPQ